MSSATLAVSDVASTMKPIIRGASDASSDQIDSIAVVYLIVSFLGLAALLQFLGVYREQIRRFNSAFVRRGLQTITYCFESRLFHFASNEIVTRGHINMFELVVRTTVDFFYDAPNLITFAIGTLQVLSTYNPDNPLQAKFVNLVALSINYLYTMVREIGMYIEARKFDDSRNSKIYKLVQHAGGDDEMLLSDRSSLLSLSSIYSGIESKNICKGDVLRMDYGETFPAECRVVDSSEVHTLINTKEESGEDCSSIFSKGDLVPYGGRVSSQGASVIVRVVETRNSIILPAATGGSAHLRRMERFPEHMNKYLTAANLLALGLLSMMAACSVFLTLYVFEKDNDGTDDANHLLFVHFFSMVAQLNMLIPSMRWIILYFLFVFLVDFGYPSVTVQSHVATRRLQSVEAVYTDKTGTLTDSEIGVESIDFFPGLDQLANLLKADRLSLACIIILACNDTQPGNGEGTSPEEMVLAEHLRTGFQCWIEKNPLKPKNEIMIISVNNHTIEFKIVSRSGYIPSEFCRVAEIEVFGSRLTVRQGGSDRMAAVTGDKQVVRSEMSAARSNPNRAFAWTVCTLGGDSFFCVRGTFTNPPRTTSEDLVKFFKKDQSIAVRMLTGDALEAAKHIAVKVGIHEDGIDALILRQDFDSEKEFILEVTKKSEEAAATDRLVTVLIEGSQLIKIIEQNDDHSVLFMKNKKVNMVIYRTKSADKAVIVRHASEHLKMGCAMIGDAANDKHALALPNIVSVALRHGAAPCRVVADVVITEPCDLIDFWTSCQWLHLNGAKALLVNTCMIGAVISGLTWVGILHNAFTLLPKGFLYPDPYDTRLMLVFSSLVFAPSACAAVLGRYSNASGGRAVIKIRAFLVLITGLLGGIFFGYMGPKSWYSTWMLSLVIVAAMASHALIAHLDFFAKPRSFSSTGTTKLGSVVDFMNRGPARILIAVFYIAVLLLASRIH